METQKHKIFELFVFLTAKISIFARNPLETGSE